MRPAFKETSFGPGRQQQLPPNFQLVISFKNVQLDNHLTDHQLYAKMQLAYQKYHSIPKISAFKETSFGPRRQQQLPPNFQLVISFKNAGKNCCRSIGQIT